MTVRPVNARNMNEMSRGRKEYCIIIRSSNFDGNFGNKVQARSNEREAGRMKEWFGFGERSKVKSALDVRT